MRAKGGATAQSAQPTAAASSSSPSASAPNVFWRSVPIEALRARHPRVVPLPPLSRVALAPLPPPAAAAALGTSPYVRQGTPAWALLRRGAATTASLPDLVGLRLHAAAGAGKGRRRGGGGSGRGDAAADAERRRQAALARLRLPPAGAEELAAALRGDAGDEGGGIVADTAADAANANEAARAACFAGKAKRAAADSSSSEEESLPWLLLGGGSGGGGAADADSNGQQQRRASDERDYCRAVLLRAAALGAPEVPVRLAWGQAQEAAALEAVLRAFPRARLEEVGAVFFLPSGGGGGGGGGGSLGRAAGAAARVGASPDALIAHPPVAWTGEDLRAAAEAWQRRRGGGGGADGEEEEGARREARLVLLRRALARAAAAGEQDADAPPPPPLLPLSAAAAGAPDAAAELDAAADAAIAAAAAAAAAAAGDDDADRFDRAAASLPAFTPREAVEVKNHSPFKLKGAKQKARGGGWRLEFCRPPRAQPLADRPRPQWLLQAQAHALCCGLGSALVVSRCAIAGSRVFRVFADASYQRELLALLDASAAEAQGGGGGGGGLGDEAAAAAAAERRAAFGERTRRMAEAVGAESVVAEVPPAEGSAPESEAFV
jgi:hypothetical protein